MASQWPAPRPRNTVSLYFQGPAGLFETAWATSEKSSQPVKVCVFFQRA